MKTLHQHKQTVQNKQKHVQASLSLNLAHFNTARLSRKKYVSQEELLCLLMGKMGFSGRHISRRTDFSVRRVYNKLKKAGIKLWDFRNGKTQWSKSVTKNCTNHSSIFATK